MSGGGFVIVSVLAALIVVALFLALGSNRRGSPRQPVDEPEPRPLRLKIVPRVAPAQIGRDLLAAALADREALRSRVAVQILAKLKGKRVLSIDVETTGFGPSAKIVSIGIAEMLDLRPTGRELYLVFDPGKACPPKATEIHGLSDWYLRHQGPFSDSAAAIIEFCSGADHFAAHNVQFDSEFVERELLPLKLPGVEWFCTMITWRAVFPGMSASMDACLAVMKARRSGQCHSALEDARFVLQLLAYLAGAEPPVFGAFPAPSNERSVPPLPSGRIPRRSRKKRKAAGPVTPI